MPSSPGPATPTTAASSCPPRWPPGAAACLVEAKGAEAFGFDAHARGRDGRPEGRHRPARQHLPRTTPASSSTWWPSPAPTARPRWPGGWLRSLSLLGRRCGVVGTLGVGEPPSAAAPAASVLVDRPHHARPGDAANRLPPLRRQRLLRPARSRPRRSASSSSAWPARSIGVALFTNFTRDHIDYHGDMDTYWAAKAQLFAWPGLRAAVLNVDDERGAALAPSLAGLDVWTYSTQQVGPPAGQRHRLPRWRPGLHAQRKRRSRSRCAAA